MLPILRYTPSWLHGTEEPAAMEGTSAAGPTTGLEGTDLAGPSSRGEGTSVACAGACSVEVGVGRPSEETGSALEDIPGTGEIALFTCNSSFHPLRGSRDIASLSRTS